MANITRYARRSTLHIPKAEEVKPRQIQIRAADGGNGTQGA